MRATVMITLYMYVRVDLQGATLTMMKTIYGSLTTPTATATATVIVIAIAIAIAVHSRSRQSTMSLYNRCTS